MKQLKIILRNDNPSDREFENEINWKAFEEYLQRHVLTAKTQKHMVRKYKEWLEYIYGHLGAGPFNAKRSELIPGETHAPLYVKLMKVLALKYSYAISRSAISALRKYLQFKEQTENLQE
ncbi:MAG: hypothetical protein COS41_03625 [Elusimicrobia bacterium CG03_land_8_20_14_0_80_50_18]|nr:MAG: hypothetical protein COS41_03625 [Elusimicrobia bacterium CG03_land_8_20_14_0_80_50_18]